MINFNGCTSLFLAGNQNKGNTIFTSFKEDSLIIYLRYRRTFLLDCMSRYAMPFSIQLFILNRLFKVLRRGA